MASMIPLFPIVSQGGHIQTRGPNLWIWLQNIKHQYPGPRSGGPFLRLVTQRLPHQTSRPAVQNIPIPVLLDGQSQGFVNLMDDGDQQEISAAIWSSPATPFGGAEVGVACLRSRLATIGTPGLATPLTRMVSSSRPDLHDGNLGSRIGTSLDPRDPRDGQRG